MLKNKKQYKKIDYKVKRKENKILDLFYSIFTLKNTVRTGWVKYHHMKKENSETVAEHTFSVATLAYLFAREYRSDLDADKVLKMLVFHEFGEVYAGDIPLRDFPDLKEKRESEKKSMEKVFSKVKAKDEVVGLWEEFENADTKEAKFCLQFDKLEAVLQAFLYNQEVEPKVNYKSFIKMAEDKFFDKEILELLEELKNSNKNK